MNRTDRLHAIHEHLRRVGAAGRTAAWLADDLEVSVRTIKRDITALQQAGAPIWSQPGPGGGYVLDGAATLPPIAFSPAQAVAVAAALAGLPPGSPFAADARTATDKLLDTLGPSARTRADALARRVWVRHDPTEDTAAPTVLRSVEQALVDHSVLSATYQSPGNDPTELLVEPILLAWTEGRWYLVAHCQLRNDIRWLRLGRITRAACTADRYTPRPVTDVGQPPEGAAPVERP